MKLLSIISVFFICVLTISQKKNSDLIGKWKLTAFQSENVTYNSITDSIIFSKAHEKNIPKIIRGFNYKQLDSLKEVTKKDFSNNTMVFKEDNTYLRTKNGITIQLGTYKIKASKKTIELKFNTKQNKARTYFAKYKVIDNDLYLTSYYGNTNKPMAIFILKKIE